MTDREPDMATATFGAGCFWGVEEAFRRTPGVTETAVGYMGGHLENPSYQAVCTDRTGHAEVVQVQFDPSQIDYERLLEIFWELHDPTTLNRQGPDVGTQYRSAVFYHDEAQQAAAAGLKARLQASGRFRRPIVTEITPASTFWRAEEYHQKYIQKNGGASCHL
ncbi:MAG: peptide-methionine (S)-S-oxide reductase MsrA [Isosphaeraceae bacterium]|jgi:peptide-methionine (S)-S-oxide reductase